MPLPLRHASDLVQGAQLALGPLCVSHAALLELLRLTGEDYPIHTDAVFAAAAPAQGPLVPGVVLWELLDTLEARALGPVAWTAPPTLDADYVRPLRCDETFLATTEVLPPTSAGLTQLRWRVRRADEEGAVVALALRRGRVAPGPQR